ncbi:hypothetical protein SUGI_0548070 [Cryptomeria japonica]|nr:hypothetical protein SUGI_0548070 [Cryptomeria japonica]
MLNHKEKEITNALELFLGRDVRHGEDNKKLHLFNTSSISLAMGLRSLGKRMKLPWKGAIGMNCASLPKEKSKGLNEEDYANSSFTICKELLKWVLYLYINYYLFTLGETTRLATMDSRGTILARSTFGRGWGMR